MHINTETSSSSHGSFHTQECGWTLAQDVFVVDFSVSLKPLPLQSVHDSISFSASSSVTPVTLSWDFGDVSSRVNTTGRGLTTAPHKYGLPGHYAVSLLAWAGNKEVREKYIIKNFLYTVWSKKSIFLFIFLNIIIIIIICACSGLCTRRSGRDTSSQTGAALSLSCSGQ